MRLRRLYREVKKAENVFETLGWVLILVLNTDILLQFHWLPRCVSIPRSMSGNTSEQFFMVDCPFRYLKVLLILAYKKYSRS